MSLKSCLVRDYMANQITTFKPDDEIMDAIHKLVERRIAGAPVVDNKGDLIGMLSELDCMKVALNAGYYGDWGGPVADYMTTTVESVDSEMNIVDLAQKFLDSGYRRFPVLRNNRLVGQISRRDALRALSELAVD